MELELAVSSLSALAQPTRLRVIRLLSGHPDGVMAGELARMVEIPRNTMSAHLAILSRAGLVSGERNGREIVYRADAARILEIGSFVAACAHGTADE